MHTTLTLSPQDKTIVSHLVCKGSPLPLLELLPEKQKTQVFTKMRLLTLPDNATNIDVTIDSYFDWDNEPEFSLYGDLVLNDFAIKGHEFTYGATTFLANYKDYRWNILLPVIMLERPEGQAMMAIAFNERDDTPLAIPTGEKDLIRKQLDFKIDSSITGNVVLDLFLKNWNKEVVNFPYGTNARVVGTINYLDNDKDYAEINILDADYFWNGLEINHVTSDCLYRYGYLHVIDAKGEVSGGDITVNHESWFKQFKSKTSVAVKNANFSDLVEQYDISLPTGSKPGAISVNALVNGVYSKTKKAEFYGSGNTVITDAELWAIPVLSSLQGLIDQSWTLNQFGKISSLNSTFTFEKDHIHANPIETDGSIVSLVAHGDYYWSSHKLDFTTQVKVLKDALPFKLLSYAFSPLSWFFEARLTGDKNESKWTSTRMNGDIFSKE